MQNLQLEIDRQLEPNEALATARRRVRLSQVLRTHEAALLEYRGPNLVEYLSWTATAAEGEVLAFAESICDCRR